MDSDPASQSFVALLLQDAPASALDPGTLIAGLTVLLLLLLASAVFSGSEVALFSLGDQAREALEGRGDRASKRVLHLLSQPRSLLVTILILNTVVNVGAAILAAVLTGLLAHALYWSTTITVIMEVIALTFVLLVLSEITPKLIATQHALTYSRWVSGVLMVFHRILYPLSHVLARSTQFVHGRFRPARRQISPDDLKVMADVGEAHGTLEQEERDLIYSIVEFGATTVREIMVSRLDVVALPVTASLKEALELIRESGHSRMPLYIEHLDNILGIVYAKDLLPYLQKSNGAQRVDWTRLARPAIFVPLGKKLDDLLRDFQTKKTHIAIVVDEYGGTAGLVTLEDVLEEIVGDIRDEHDEAEEALYREIEEGVYHFDARINLDDLNELMDVEIDTESFDFETLGGLIFHLAGAIPAEGDELEHDGLLIRVETIENHRIGQVQVKQIGPTHSEQLVPETPRSPANERTGEDRADGE